MDNARSHILDILEREGDVAAVVFGGAAGCGDMGEAEAVDGGAGGPGIDPIHDDEVGLGSTVIHPQIAAAIVEGHSLHPIGQREIGDAGRNLGVGPTVETAVAIRIPVNVQGIEQLIGLGAGCQWRGFAAYSARWKGFWGRCCGFPGIIGCKSGIVNV